MSINPLIDKDGDPVDEDIARVVLQSMGLSPQFINWIIDWHVAYGDLKDETWAYSD